MGKNKFIEKAALQALCEVLGFDEGRAYHLLLLCRKQEIEDEFSYSKRYRILKNLFGVGAVGKIKSEGKDFFSYLLLPPSFLYEHGIDYNIVSFLEELYVKNHNTLGKIGFSQIIVRDEKGLVLYLLKHSMKEYAKLKIGEVNFNGELGGIKDKVEVMIQQDEKRKIGVIDGNIVFELSILFDRDKHDYVGYILNRENSRHGKLEEERFSAVMKDLERY